MKFILILFRKIIIPSAYYIRGDLRFKYFNLYKKNLTKSKKEIKNYQLARLKALMSHAYDTVPYYKDLFDSINLKTSDIKSIDDLKKIPVLTKEIILKHQDELKSKVKYKLIEWASGGSTGNRVVIFKDKRYSEISRAVWMRNLSAVGINPGDKAAWIWGSPFENKNLKYKTIHKLLWRINRKILFNATHYTNAELELWLKNDFNSFKPDYIYGYANSVYQIAKYIKENNIKIHQVKKIITTSEKLEHREFIEKVFNCKVIDQYGSREITTMAIEDENQVMHTDDDFVIVELGENNKILITALESYGMPLIRYVIGDIGIRNKKHEKNDNHPFERFNLSVGRFCELFVNNKGEKISLLPLAVRAGVAKLSIGEYQLVQISKDKVEVNMVKDKNIKSEDVKKFMNMIKDYVGCSTVKVRYFDKYPLEKNGKKIGFKCLVKEA